MPPHRQTHTVLTRRRFLAGGAITAAAIGLYAGEIERHFLSTVHRTVLIRNLPTAFRGFRIAQLSDFHFHNYDASFFVAHAVRVLNDLKPDLVALTGDFITSNRDDGGRKTASLVANLDDCAAILSGIHCPLRFCSMGNHDVVLKRYIREVLQRHGHTLLLNQYAAIDLQGDRMWVSGLADAYSDMPNLVTAIPKRKEGEPLLLLGHEPDFADSVSEISPADLMLAGHTHGGQVRIPFMPAVFLPSMGLKYVEGLFQLRSGMQLYVNRGLGCMHLPFRFNCPPELTLITLQPV